MYRSRHTAERFKALLDAQDSLGWTALHYAAGRGDVDAVRTLLKAGARIEILTHSGNTTLHTATVARAGNPVLCTDLLLDAGVDVNVANPVDNATALSGAVESENVELAQRLISRGARVNFKFSAYQISPFFRAVSANDLAMARLLMENGADVDEGDYEGDSPLEQAAGTNTHKTLQFLLDVGANYRCEITGVHGSILHAAALGGDAETMRILAHHGLDGVDVECRDKEGLTAAQVFGQRNTVSEDLKDAFSNLLVKVGGVRKEGGSGQIGQNTVEVR